MAKPKTPAQPKGQPAKPKVAATPAKSAAKARKPEIEPPDLKAALPYFLVRIAVFVVLTMVLIAVGVNVIWSLLFGMAAAAVVTYPIARIQKRVSRRQGDTPAAAKPDKAAKPAKPAKPGK
ncbi:hypothetical protein I6A84_03545 [Frankia sp. CNm7]|uniref:hypothetical protein n=1 Tax=Frankia nepalensis TaxID=1836974 RepID=UPI001932A957|nr:hypothetical protein [Frankia nepalensis]MBL7517220.1 hypothetical protein [Frankia nepalensis]